VNRKSDPGCQYSLANEEDPMYENSTYKRLQDMHEEEDYYHAALRDDE
jgi:hypothetical protein